MSAKTRNRQPEGLPVGGQFAKEAGTSTGINLADAGGLSDQEAFLAAAESLERAVIALDSVRSPNAASALIGGSQDEGLMGPLRQVVVAYVAAGGSPDPDARVESIMDAIGEGTPVRDAMGTASQQQTIMQRSAVIIADLAADPDTGEIDPTDPFTDGQIQLAVNLAGYQDDGFEEQQDLLAAIRAEAAKNRRRTARPHTSRA